VYISIYIYIISVCMCVCVYIYIYYFYIYIIHIIYIYIIEKLIIYVFFTFIYIYNIYLYIYTSIQYLSITRTHGQCGSYQMTYHMSASRPGVPEARFCNNESIKFIIRIVGDEFHSRFVVCWMKEMITVSTE